MMVFMVHSWIPVHVYTDVYGQQWLSVFTELYAIIENHA